jgi:hypothetical protein
MSFEGYYQRLCEEGHYSTQDCYASFGVQEADWACPICGKGQAWWNLVDVTNGSFDDETGERVDGYIELEEKTPAEYCTCSTCGNRHVVKKATYKIPEMCGRRVPKKS